MTDHDDTYMRRAIQLALESEAEGNLPIGAVITLDNAVIAEGQSAILKPEYDPGRHAEIVALDGVDTELWPRAAEMTCYTTLEPCVMCAGTLLLHGVGRVVFGAHDEQGGAGAILDHLPPYYDDGGVFDWEGPLMPTACRPLYERADAAFEELPVGRKHWADEGKGSEPSDEPDLRAELDAWLEEEPGRMSTSKARQAILSLAERLEPEQHEDLLPYAVALFRRGGYKKDYSLLRRYSSKVGRPDAIEAVDETLREELPDMWIRQAIQRGDLDAAVEAWFEFEDHSRARHVSDELVEVCDEDEVQLIISCRMSKISYLIGRSARRHYRKACTILRQLRDELDRAGASDYWHLVLEDLQEQHDNRPALLDELERAGFVS